MYCLLYVCKDIFFWYSIDFKKLNGWLARRLEILSSLSSRALSFFFLRLRRIGLLLFDQRPWRLRVASSSSSSAPALTLASRPLRPGEHEEHHRVSSAILYYS